MKSIAKAGRLKASGMLFILSGATWFLAAALGDRLTLMWVGVLYLCVGTIFIARSKKSVTT